MVKGKKRFEFLTFDVDVVLRDDVPPGFEEVCSGGIYNILDKTEKITGVTIWFKDCQTWRLSRTSATTSS